MNKFIGVFFYGNIFLGICAVLLCVETNLLINISLNVFPFYLLIFFCTCMYYTMIYVRSVGTKNCNERTIWYRTNLIAIKKTLKIALFAVIAFLLFLVWKNIHTLLLLSPSQFLLIVLLPLMAAWYTFSPTVFRLKNIRQTGWIKPFVVGLTWSGWVTVYPILISKVQTNQPAISIISPYLLLWLQNFLFITVVAIIFDVKDYRTDFSHHLKTFPVTLGIRKTFRFIIIPITLLNLVVFFLFQAQEEFSSVQIVLQLIPYLLLILILAKHRQQKSLLYYLVAVDGLLFAKALCGIVSIILLKNYKCLN